MLAVQRQLEIQTFFNNLPRHVADYHLIPNFQDKAREDLETCMACALDSGELQVHVLKHKVMRWLHNNANWSFGL